MIIYKKRSYKCFYSVNNECGPKEEQLGGSASPSGRAEQSGSQNEVR